jgi:hypothetical protein
MPSPMGNHRVDKASDHDAVNDVRYEIAPLGKGPYQMESNFKKRTFLKVFDASNIFVKENVSKLYHISMKPEQLCAKHQNQFAKLFKILKVVIKNSKAHLVLGNLVDSN